MTLPPFAGWAGPHNPKLLIVGEAWGENELQTRQPFVGSSGRLLWEMLGQACPDVAPEQHSASLREAFNLGNAWIRNRSTWLHSAGIAYTNVFNIRPPANKIEALCAPKKDVGATNLPALARGLYVRAEYMPEVDRLLHELSESRPNCVVAAGNTASWALLHTTSISAIRGAVTISAAIPGLKVVPTYHPAAVSRQWSWRPITVADLQKAYREAEYPELIRPERYVIINPDLHEIVAWKDRALNEAEILAVDIETQWKMIKCIGFSWNKSEALVIPFIDNSKLGSSYWPTFEDEKVAWKVVRLLLESGIPKLFQNGMYDLQYILKTGIRPRNLAHDTMLLHHSLYPEMRKGLGFLGSIYTNEAAWKLMSRPRADTTKRDE